MGKQNDKRFEGKKQQKAKPMVAKDKTTILRVEPYNHFGKHSLRPFVDNKAALFVATKKKGKKADAKAEKKFLTSEAVREHLTANNSELCRRLDFGLSMKSANIQEFLEFCKNNKDKILDMVQGLQTLVDSEDGKKLQKAAAYINTSNEQERNNEKAKEHVGVYMNFFQKDDNGLDSLMRTVAMFSARAYLGSTSLFECRALFEKSKEWAKKVEPKSRQSKAVKSWLENGSSEEKLKKALVGILGKDGGSKKKKTEKQTKMSDSEGDSSDEDEDKADTSNSDSKSGDDDSSEEDKKKKKRKPDVKKKGKGSSASSESEKTKKKIKKKKASSSSSSESKKDKKKKKDKKQKEKKKDSDNEEQKSKDEKEEIEKEKTKQSEKKEKEAIAEPEEAEKGKKDEKKD